MAPISSRGVVRLLYPLRMFCAGVGASPRGLSSMTSVIWRTTHLNLSCCTIRPLSMVVVVIGAAVVRYIGVLMLLMVTTPVTAASMPVMTLMLLRMAACRSWVPPTLRSSILARISAALPDGGVIVTMAMTEPGVISTSTASLCTLFCTRAEIVTFRADTNASLRKLSPVRAAKSRFATVMLNSTRAAGSTSSASARRRGSGVVLTFDGALVVRALAAAARMASFCAEM
mmetsp:Transcript_36635/g.96991  ORF Transcript_36635/g.96991 Transcript_36635/m.96991 type:complete len:229 (+) Transcript_36635:181-867(+)